MTRRPVPRLIAIGLAALLLGTARAETPAGPVVDTSRLPAVTTGWAEPNPLRGQAEASRVGRDAFNQTCARCHGMDANGAMKSDNSGKLAPALANNARVNGHRDWILNVLVAGLTGALPSTDVKDIMIPMGSNNDQWIADVASYVRINFGNTGSVALPATLTAAVEAGAVKPGYRVGLLGIGSGLNCLMLALEW